MPTEDSLYNDLFGDKLIEENSGWFVYSEEDGLTRIHQIWIGPNVPPSALTLNESLAKEWKSSPIHICYWVDEKVMSKEEVLKITDSVKENERVFVQICDIRKLSVYDFIKSLKLGGENGISLYDSLYLQGSFNFIKELFTYYILYEYGGHFFDTTFTYSPTGRYMAGVHTPLNESDRLVIPKIGSLNDLFYSYSSQGNQLTRILAVNVIINTYMYAILTLRRQEYRIKNGEDFNDIGSKLLSFSEYLDYVRNIKYSDDDELNNELHKLTYRFVEGRRYHVLHPFDDRRHHDLGLNYVQPQRENADGYSYILLAYHVRQFLYNVISLYNEQYGSMLYITIMDRSYNRDMILKIKDMFFIKQSGNTGWHLRGKPSIFMIPGVN